MEASLQHLCQRLVLGRDWQFVETSIHEGKHDLQYFWIVVIESDLVLFILL
jgi:hypothetical protein